MHAHTQRDNYRVVLCMASHIAVATSRPVFQDLFPSQQITYVGLSVRSLEVPPGRIRWFNAQIWGLDQYCWIDPP